MGALHPTDTSASCASFLISWDLSLSNLGAAVVDSFSVAVAVVESISDAKNGVFESFSACSDVRRTAGLTLGENADAVVKSVHTIIVGLFRIMVCIFLFFINECLVLILPLEIRISNDYNLCRDLLL